MRSQTRSQTDRRAFTLIELLVVIAIIAVLISLLLAGRAIGTRGRPPRPVHEQPQADRPGSAQLRELQQLLPAGWRIDQFQQSFRRALQPVRRRGLERLARILPLHGRRHLVQRPELQSRGIQRRRRHRTSPAARRSWPSSSAPHRPASPTAAATASTPTTRLLRPSAAATAYNDYGPTVLHRHQPDRRSAGSARLPPRPTATRPPAPTACSSRARPGSPRSPTAPATRSPSAEDAGRDPRYLSPYLEGYWDGDDHPPGSHGRDQSQRPRAGGGYTPYRRYWRWAEPDDGFGVSGLPNNKYRPDHELSNWPSPPFIAQGNNAGNNDELASFHPGGVNILMGDG